MLRTARDPCCRRVLRICPQATHSCNRSAALTQECDAWQHLFAAGRHPASCLKLTCGVQAQDPIVALLASNSEFANAVNAKQLDAAAAIAVQLVKVRCHSHLLDCTRAFHCSLRPSQAPLCAVALKRLHSALHRCFCSGARCIVAQCGLAQSARIEARAVALNV